MLKRAYFVMPPLAYDAQGDPRKPWVLLHDYVYRSVRYGKTVTLRKGYRSDGASFIARDIMTRAWLIHDWFCDGLPWDDGTHPTRWQSSTVLSDILCEDGYSCIAPVWRMATWIGGIF